MTSASAITTISVFSALGMLSLVGTTVAIFKIIQFNRLGVGKLKKAEAILDAWLGGRPDEAMRAASKRDCVLGRVLQGTLTALRARPNDSAYAEELGRQSALIELTAMSSRMRVLETVIQAGPMLGLLGTVVGMIQAFATLADAGGAADPAQLASGIWTSLTTTATGLAIALTAYFIANWLEARIERERLTIETLISAAIHGRIEAKSAKGGR
ncbi:outer membrane transport energization protein ExbB [Rhodobacter aestuarii]|uniref:Outer membrane transport energization protein ExbB n=1 Tax=Rhodobacter aestuarii TaxID=453582 RepID=A0A1N7JW87_9RHOB|nr:MULTISPECIES: MotA/TolQ/ExbB proton channel family protein [Rhodobacter]PTV95962.1 outer membrane transport energization protein ExbB [Rhodobacter aestuarii]SIS53609.1 outer membrane transport energization protein ExbB [Rhodobacter aestuarii]SOC10561.1 outer membrane transport energization protein ExbB [Rhodobacter sp. JA431]